MRELLSKRVSFENLEGYADFNFSLRRRAGPPGVSAMLRVKDEEPLIWSCLASILGVFDEIVVVDNASSDATVSIVREFKRAFDRHDTMRLHHYPFTITPHGPDDRIVSSDSVHSRVYYYNWCISRCGLSHACKWDGDMILKADQHDSLERVFGEARRQPDRRYVLSGQTVYRDLAGDFFLARGEVWSEPRLFPARYKYHYARRGNFPSQAGRSLRALSSVPGATFYEVKLADRNEFSHWATTDFPTRRKQREWESFQLIRSGRSHDERFEPLAADPLLSELPVELRPPGAG